MKKDRINLITKALKLNKYRITKHSKDEAHNDRLNFNEIFCSVFQGEIIEEYSGENDMMPFIKCPVCSGDIIEKQVEEIIYSGNNALIITVNAEVCLKCGERLYSPEVIQKMESIKIKLEKNEIEGFKKIGQFYKAA